MRAFTWIFIALFQVSLLLAQDANVSLKASKTEVAVGEQFSIILSADVNGNGDLNLPREFQVLSRMSGSSSRFINGRQSFEVTRTFIVVANKVGEYTIPPATWSYGSNKTATSNSLKIKVVEGSASPPQQQQQQYHDPFGGLFGPPRQQQQPQATAPDRHFGMLITNKREVFVGEPIIISGKVFFDGHIVDVADFETYGMNLMAHKTDLRADKVNLSVSREEYGGRMYQTIPLFEDLIIPQQAGEFTFSPFSIKIGFQRGFFDRGYKLVKSNESSIVVKPLPAGAPEGFDGAVGNFKVDVAYDAKPEMQAGDIIGITVKIEGSGNINLLKALELDLPEGIVLYGDPKIENKIKVTKKGAQGTIEYDFIAQIEKGGQYDFVPFHFAYFNPESKRYQSIEIPAMQFEAIGELISEKEAEEIALAEEEEKLSSQVWKSISLMLLAFLLLLGLGYFLKKNSNLFKFKPKKRKVDAHAVAKKALVALDSNNRNTLNQVEHIITRFFKDFTQDEALLLSEAWFVEKASNFGISETLAEQWRVHYSSIQAMKYANFGQMSNVDLIQKSLGLVEKTH